MQEQLCINIPGFPLSILPPLLLLEILYYLVFISTSSHRPLKLNGLWRFGSKCDGEQCYTRAKCPTACCIESIEIIIVTGRYWLLLLRLLAIVTSIAQHGRKTYADRYAQSPQYPISKALLQLYLHARSRIQAKRQNLSSSNFLYFCTYNIS